MKLPTHLVAKETQALERAVTALAETRNAQIRFVALFGSKARGDFEEESDIDLLIVSETDDWRTRDFIREPVFDVNIDFGLHISPRVISQEQFLSLSRRRPGFWANLRRDAIELWRRPDTDNPLHPAQLPVAA